MKQELLRRRLIDGTIHVVASQGLDKATTKQIGIITKTNEAYIYRCFEDKADMLTKAFDALDEELVNKALFYVDVMNMHQLEFKTRCRLFFFAMWKFLLGNREKCLTYVRYYYSPYFSKYSAQSHRYRYKPLINRFKGAFREEADVWMILNHILNVMLDFAVKVHNGQMSKDDDYSEHVFRVVYASVKQYFKEDREGDC